MTDPKSAAPSSKLNAGASAFVPRANESSSSGVATPVLSAAVVPPMPPPQASNHAMLSGMGAPGSGSTGVPAPSFRQNALAPPRPFQPTGPPSMPQHHNAAVHRPPPSHHVQVGYPGPSGMYPSQPMVHHHQSQYPPPAHHHMGGHMPTHMTAGGGMGHHPGHHHHHHQQNYNPGPPQVSPGAHLGGGGYPLHPQHAQQHLPHHHHHAQSHSLPHHNIHQQQLSHHVQPGHHPAGGHMMGPPTTLHSHHHHHAGAHSHHIDPRSSVAVGSHPPHSHASHHLHSNQQQHQAPLAPDRSIMSKPPAEVPLPIALLVVCTGTMETVKSELCHLIEEQHNLRHIALEDEYNDDGSLVCSRLEILEKKLTQALDEPSPPIGFVVENAVVRCKHEIFLVDDMLQRLKIRLEAVVLLDNSGATVNSEEIDPIKHPVGFEVCAKYFTEGDLVVLNKTEAFTAAEAMEMINEGHAKRLKPTSASLHKEVVFPPEENLAPGLVLERNASQTVMILRDVATTLGLSDMFTAPSVVAARVLEYSYFTRRAHFLRSYQGHILRDGERVTVVGWHKHTYVLTGPTGICFRVNDASLVPHCLKRQLESTQTQQPLAFVLGGVLVSTPAASSGEPPQHRIFLHEVFYLLGRLGSQMYLTERMTMIQDLFNPDKDAASGKPSATNETSPFLVVEPFYQLKNLTRSLDGASCAQGLVLVNPGYLLPGTFERLNYVWWSTDWKNIEVRLWSGQLKTIGGGQWWVFDAMVLDPEGKEVKLKDPVLIEDERVSTDCLNDGNIVECRWIVEPGSGGAGAPGSGASGSGKAGKQAKPVVASPFPSPRFSYVKRRLWSIYPVSKVFADAILSPTPTWPIDSLTRATAYLEPLPITPPEVVREKREFDGEDD